MKRTIQMAKARTPSASQKGKKRGNKPWRMQLRVPGTPGDYRDEPVHAVRSLHSVGGERPGSRPGAKRKKHMALKAGFGSWDEMQAAMRKVRA